MVLWLVIIHDVKGDDNGEMILVMRLNFGEILLLEQRVFLKITSWVLMITRY